MTTQDPNRLVGTVLGSRFEITACVAIDEAGARYDAKDSELLTSASVRVLHRIRPDDASLRKLLELLTEVSNLAIPGIKPLRAVGRTRTQDVYYATDEVRGQSLAQRLDRGAMHPLEAVTALTQAGETLSRAHGHGVLHGALHPGAVILPGKGEGDEVQLIDFGLGPLVLASDTLPMGTRSAATPYQSPEQAKSDPFDQRADVYALGALLYEMLTGRPPFAGRSALEILAHQLRGEAPSLAEVEPALEGSPLQSVIDQSMQVDPSKRFDSVEAMVRALRNAGKTEATRKKPTLKRKPSLPVAADLAAKKGAPEKADAKPPRKQLNQPKAAKTKPSKESPVLYLLGGGLVLGAVLWLVLHLTGLLDEAPSEPESVALQSAGEAAPSRPSQPEPPPEVARVPTSRPPRQRSQPAKTPTAAQPLVAQVEPLPERALKLVLEGQEALGRKNYSLAIARFRSAKRSAPDAPEIARGLGLSYMYAGQTSPAVAELQRYLELQPDAADASFMRSTIRSLQE